ncbi:MAG TPA: patatin-like phospholipase family protein, partial [Thermodesulfovibrionales bacterium]|nr:patatin-like phospholipase family protein [Thermodesulfovibrionales bacterium]
MLRHSITTILIILILTTASCAPKEVKPPQRPARVAVVLGAGVSRGFAHIGVLKVLEANKIPIHMVVGTSVGSLVGGLYAYGFDAFQLQKISFEIEKTDIVDVTVPDNGFIKGEKLEEYVNRMLKNTPIERLRIPFYAVATDIQNGSEVVFGRGNTGTAVRASCSIPGIFRPVKIDNKMYVDGGVVSPVAVDAAKRLGADVVIAVDISSSLGEAQPEGTVDTILQAITIMYSKLASMQLSRADIVIRPKVGSIAAGDFSKRHEAILEGEEAATEALPSIRGIIERLRLEGR